MEILRIIFSLALPVEYLIVFGYIIFEAIKDYLDGDCDSLDLAAEIAIALLGLGVISWMGYGIYMTW